MFLNVILIVTVILAFIVLYLTDAYYRAKIDVIESKMSLTIEEAVTKARTKSLDAQRAVVKGHVAEQVFSILPGCPFLPSDMRFIGNPIDYIAFEGYTDAKDDNGDIQCVTFIDIKQGGAKLSRHQELIRKAVEEGRVRWKTIHIDSLFQIKERPVL